MVLNWVQKMRIYFIRMKMRRCTLALRIRLRVSRVHRSVQPTLERKGLPLLPLHLLHAGGLAVYG